MRDFDLAQQGDVWGSIPDRFAAWIAVALVGFTTSQFALGQEPPKNFVLHDAPKPIAALAFDDDEGRSRSLADFKGKVVLLNIWATWCVPCRKEMPALDRLQAALGGPDFEVVALSIDRGGMDVVRKFLGDIGVRHLAVYLDTAGKAMRALGALGLPTTLLVGRDGLELGRLVGPAEWDSPEAIAFVRSIIAESSTARSDTAPPPADAATPGRQP
jgi:thiol-disulfide isomerase/thioredoxin